MAETISFNKMPANQQREVVENLSVIMLGKCSTYLKKYTKILDGAQEKYPNDEDFEKFESYISNRIDSADIEKFRDFANDTKSYVLKARTVAETLESGFYLLFEKKDSDGGNAIYEYDCMGFAMKENDAIDWVEKNPDYRFKTYCPFKEVKNG